MSLCARFQVSVSSGYDLWHRQTYRHGFYPNVIALRSGFLFAVAIPSVVCLSVCRLWSVTLVHPTQGVEPFGKISSPLCTLAIL